MTLGDIEKIAKLYGTRRAALAALVAECNDQLREVKNRHVPDIRTEADRVAASESKLRTAIDEGRDLFVKPRTLTLAGILCGFRKGPGSLEWDDPDQVVERIKRLMPDRAAQLIAVSERPSRSDLAKLTAQELRRLGVSLIEAGDYVYVRAADSEIDKLVTALLKE